MEMCQHGDFQDSHWINNQDSQDQEGAVILVRLVKQKEFILYLFWSRLEQQLLCQGCYHHHIVAYNDQRLPTLLIVILEMGNIRVWYDLQLLLAWLLQYKLV